MTAAQPRVGLARVIARTNVGGPSLQITALMRGLDRERFDQVLFRGSVSEGEADYLDLRAPDVASTMVPGLGRSVRPLDDLRALRFLVGRLREMRPTIVHTHTAKAGVLGRLAAIVARVPIRVHTFHGHVLSGYFSPRTTKLVALTERALALTTTHIVAVGDQVLEDLVAAKIARPGSSSVVAPGVRRPDDVDRTAALRAIGLPDDNKLVVAFVGRLTRIKRTERFVELAASLHEQPVPLRFIVIGDGPERDELERSVPAGVDVVFAGWQSDMAAVYSAADLIVLTSDNEGMPVALIEGAMQGVPAVATDVGAVRQVVADGETGYVVPVDDAAALRDAVLRIAQDAQLRSDFGAAARVRAEALFGEERLVGDYAALYERLLTQRSTRHAGSGGVRRLLRRPAS